MDTERPPMIGKFNSRLAKNDKPRSREEAMTRYHTVVDRTQLGPVRFTPARDKAGTEALYFMP